jgi:hypothetical protein
MRAILSHPGHAESFAAHGGEYAPMHELVASLSNRPYAGTLYAFNSLTTFVITSAISYSECDGHDEVLIQFNPILNLFEVGYGEWVSSTRNPPHRIAANRRCSGADVLAVVDLYVLRLRITSRHSGNGR